MTIAIGMFDKAYAAIGPRLHALGLDIAVRTFSTNGLFWVNGAEVAPSEVALDYLWLTTHINASGFRDRAFQMALDCKSIGVLQTFNAGLDHPFYKQLSQKGTRILNSSAQGIAISEYVLAQVLAVLQPIEQQRSFQRAGQWQQTPFRELSQTRWLIIGYGPIGQEIAKRVKAFGAQTSIVRRTPSASPFADTVGTAADLPALLPQADVIVLACPLNAITRSMVDAAFLAHVKPGAILVNIARGALIDDAALIAALDADRVATAVLDVFHEEPLPATNPFWTHPRVRLTAHTSFAGSGVRDRWDHLFLDAIARFARGAPLAQEVNPADIA